MASVERRSLSENHTVKFTTSYPPGLSQPKVDALKLICEQGHARSYAAHLTGTKAVELGVIMAANGLRRAPPPVVQSAMAMLARGRSIEDAERLSGAGKGRIGYWLKKLAQNPGSGRAVDVVKYGIEHDMTAAETAAKFGLCYGSVIRVATQMGVKFRKNPRFNSMVGSQRDADIADLVRSGKTLREVGRLYGISYERVRQIANRVDGQ